MMELLSFCQVSIDSQAEGVHLRECDASKQPESTDKDVMKGNDRLGARSAKSAVWAALLNLW
jgi:hypothetical protein